MDEIVEIEISKKFAVIVAIENYRKGPSTITSVKYAQNDALRFKKVLIDHFDYGESDIILLLNEHAVKTALENDLPYYIRQLTADHQFIFYYVGHGFFQAGHNKLSCWDTHPIKLDETSVSIKEVVFEPLQKSECKHSLIFLDCCSSLLKDMLSSRDVISDFNDEEFEEFIKPSSYDALFMSCSPGEKSYSSDTLNHGIWTWHLTEALSGNDEGAVVRDVFITDNSLRAYLSHSVPAFITKEKDIKGSQRPYAKINAPNDFLIRKLPRAITEIDKSLPNIKLKYEAAVFRKIEFPKIRSAKGFQPSFTIPFSWSTTTEKFVQRVFAPNIEDEVQKVYQNTKLICNLRKADIEYESSELGASVECSYFRYFIDVEHNEKKLDEAKITRRLQIRVSRKKLPENFDSIFPIYVDELIIPIEGQIEFDDIVNKFENLKDEQGGSINDNDKDKKVEYITEGGTSITIDVKQRELSITHYNPMRTIDLIDKSILDLKRISNHKIKLLI